MEGYTVSIFWAVVLFPIVAFLFTIPYILIQYHKYGSVPMLRVGIVYSFILYLLASYFLVILPLPSIEEVASYTSPTMQLLPFSFIKDFIEHTSFIWNNPSTYLTALKEPWFYQVGYNILLFVPLGIYLRYYFKCSFKKTVLLSLGMSLFFELTQLSGLYGIYPRGYRLFDVDDLMINTLGGIVGFFVAGIVMKILPSRDKLDSYAYQKGTEITIWKRTVNFFFDGFLLGCLTGLLTAMLSIFHIPLTLPSFLLYFIYFVFIPTITKGKTLGKMFLNLKVTTLEGTPPRWYQYLFRYALLYLVVLPLPFYLLLGLLAMDTYIPSISSIWKIAILGIFLLSSVLYYGNMMLRLLKQKLLWYEFISKTKNISTVKEKYETIKNEEEE